MVNIFGLLFFLGFFVPLLIAHILGDDLIMLLENVDKLQGVWYCVYNCIGDGFCPKALASYVKMLSDEEAACYLRKYFSLVVP